MVKCNIYQSNNIIPTEIDGFRYNKDELKSDFRDLEQFAFDNGYFCFREENFISFIKISNIPSNGLVIPPNLLEGNQKAHQWVINDQYGVSLFRRVINTSFRRNIKDSNDKLYVSKNSNKIHEDFSEDSLLNAQIARGIIYQPCLLDENVSYILHFKYIFPPATLMSEELLEKTQLQPEKYFSKSKFFIESNFHTPLILTVGSINFVFDLTKPLLIEDIDIYEPKLDGEEEEEVDFKEYNRMSDDIDDDETSEDLGLKYYSKKSFESPIQIFPNEARFRRGNSSRWGPNRKNTPIWTLLKNHGPYDEPDIKKLWIIPVFDEKNPRYRDNIQKICESLANFSPKYRNPGLKRWIPSASIKVVEPKPLNLDADISSWLTQLLQKQKQIDSDFPLNYRDRNPFQAFFMIQIPESEDYYRIKQVFGFIGCPLQVISNVDASDFSFEYSRWNLLSVLYSKLGQRPWVIRDLNNWRNGNLDIAIGFRFKKKDKEYISAIAIVVTGAGEFLGYYSEDFDIRKHQTKGMKLSEEQIKIMLENVTSKFLQDKQEKSILITRLGQMPEEERKVFSDYFKILGFSKFAISTMRKDLLRMATIIDLQLPLGTFIEHTPLTASLMTIGNMLVNSKKGDLSSKLPSIPTTYYLELIENQGLYKSQETAGEIAGVAKDIMNMCWLNWQSVFFPIAGLPITLSFSEKIAEFISHDVFAEGELRKTPWFL